MSSGIIRPWVVEVRCPDRSFGPEISALSRELDHLPSELFDTSRSVGLRVEVMAPDEGTALAYLDKRIRAFRRRGWVKGVDYTLDVTQRRR